MHYIPMYICTCVYIYIHYIHPYIQRIFFPTLNRNEGLYQRAILSVTKAEMKITNENKKQKKKRKTHNNAEHMWS